jgi:hypothetical protein
MDLLNNPLIQLLSTPNAGKIISTQFKEQLIKSKKLPLPQGEGRGEGFKINYLSPLPNPLLGGQGICSALP